MIIKKKVIMQTVIIIHFLQLPEDNFKPVKLHANNINIDFLCVTDRYDIPIVYEPGIDKNKEFVLDCLKGYQVTCLRIDKCKYIIAYNVQYKGLNSRFILSCHERICNSNVT